jgi:hypothetical protein
MGTDALPNHWTRPAVLFLAGSVLFGLTCGQAPLYYSNQNQYFLHGLADAGHGVLDQDWLAGTADPTPVFSALVTVTCRYLHEYGFHVYYLLLFGVYGFGMAGLFTYLAGARATPRLVLGFAALFFLVHSALVRWGSYRLFGWDYPWYLQGGLAGQYLLGAMFQPSTFGVFLVLAIYLFVRDRPFWAVASAALAATVHSTYLLHAGILTLAFLFVLWREGRGRQALWLGAWAVLLVLPTATYALATFRATSVEEFAQAQHLLVHERIPHHCIPRLWCDAIAWGQIGWMLLALVLARGTRLFLVLIVVFLLSAGLTLLQVATGNDTLALLFPWRASAVLVPVATTIILSRLVLVCRNWFDRPAAGVASAVVIVGLAGAGAAITWTGQGYLTSDDELELLDHVRSNRARDQVYLLPVQVPKLAATTRGSQSSDFKPLAAKKADARIIPVDLQRFRLNTGVPIFVDFKSIPYKDVDVLEWHRRLHLNQRIVELLRAGNWEEARERLRESGITHLVLTTDREQKLPSEAERQALGFHQVHEDPNYRVYRVTDGSVAR